MTSSSTGMYVSVYFHYSGFFSPNSLVYLDPVKTSVRDMNFGGFTYKEFLLWLTKLTKGACDNVYYYIKKESLCEGIRRIDSDADYWEFVETVYSLESELDVYIDHQNESILDWAGNKLLADGKGESGHYRTTFPQKPIEESSNASSKKKKPNTTGKVEVTLTHEVDIESNSEVEMEPKSEVESFDVKFEDDVEAKVQPEVQDEVQSEVQDEVKAEIQPKVQTQFHTEVHPKVQVEVHPEV
ncbi:unnamed protein product [Lactuca saligna]|uniref:Uncharacterized protein n=1 Tax=Lactuca saligna TaxID=75948 RepID=A0AA36E920_LACSI|nr:unnamed protein product [Lactuca saligna]